MGCLEWRRGRGAGEGGGGWWGGVYMLCKDIYSFFEAAQLIFLRNECGCSNCCGIGARTPYDPSDT